MTHPEETETCGPWKEGHQLNSQVVVTHAVTRELNCALEEGALLIVDYLCGLSTVDMYLPVGTLLCSPELGQQPQAIVLYDMFAAQIIVERFLLSNAVLILLPRKRFGCAHTIQISVTDFAVQFSRSR